MACDPSKVVCLGEGLHFGYFGLPITATIDARNAGPGELTAFCDGPSHKAFCELGDHEDGTFTLTVRPQDVGHHRLSVLYEDLHVPGSPFKLRVSSASLVEAYGPGISNGVLSPGTDYGFTLDTSNAGQGSLNIRVGGPTGAFRVQTRKDGKLLLCRYNPQVPGVYVLNIHWSGDHVPGSPFHVALGRNEAHLRQLTTRAFRT